EKKCREARDVEKANADTGCHEDADRQHRAQRAGEVGDSSRERRRDKTYRGADTEEYPDLLRGKPARLEETRQERRADAERDVHAGIERHETEQRSRHDSTLP